jgi:hypothetical protein
MVYLGAEWNRVKQGVRSKLLFSDTIDTAWNNLLQIFNAPRPHHRPDRAITDPGSGLGGVRMTGRPPTGAKQGFFYPIPLNVPIL